MVVISDFTSVDAGFWGNGVIGIMEFGGIAV